jgi:hypothetical protein
MKNSYEGEEGSLITIQRAGDGASPAGKSTRATPELPAEMRD